MNYKIATHDSLTGEKGAGFKDTLLSLFAKTQNKNLTEQLKSGCRMFDIRVRFHKNLLFGFHGLWRTKHTALTYLGFINSWACINSEPVYVNVVYEGKPNKKNLERFIIEAKHFMEIFPQIQFGDFFQKYPHWNKVLDGNMKDVLEPNPNYQQFKALDFSSWHTLIPIPILWKQFYFKHPKFNDKSFTYVDFL